MDRLSHLAVLSCALLACQRPSRGTVCGLHSASAPVLLESEGGRVLSVGARLSDADRIRATGWALLECFTGSLKVLEDERARIGELDESHTEVKAFERKAYHGADRLETGFPTPPVASKYSDNRFTPDSAKGGDEPTSGDYLRAFFTPGGIGTLGTGPRGEGPRVLPPPSGRPSVPRIRAGPLGEGGLRLTVRDEVAFAEAAGLTTAVLTEGQTYELGRTVRLILPDGAEATLHGPKGDISMEGPLDVGL